MPLFEVGFFGHWLGGVAIVKAKDVAEAEGIVKQRMKGSGLEHRVGNERFDVEEISSDNPILYYDDGNC